MAGNPNYKTPRGKKGAYGGKIYAHSTKHLDRPLDLYKQRRIKGLLPNATTAIEHVGIQPGKSTLRRICPNCGHHSTKQLPDGRCPDTAACAKRKEEWE